MTKPKEIFRDDRFLKVQSYYKGLPTKIFYLNLDLIVCVTPLTEEDGNPTGFFRFFTVQDDPSYYYEAKII